MWEGAKKKKKRSTAETPLVLALRNGSGFGHQQVVSPGPGCDLGLAPGLEPGGRDLLSASICCKQTKEHAKRSVSRLDPSMLLKLPWC